MHSTFLRLMIAGALVTGWAHAQDVKPSDAPSAESQSSDDSAATAPKETPEGSTAAAKRVVSDAKVDQDLKKKEKIRVLKPDELAGELMRLKTKADIKAELKIRTVAGRPIVFKGVIRNGKLIERIVDRHFVTQKDVSHRRCGVRLWWSGNSDGYIFFRYSTIETVTITGKLTAKERAEILRRLRAGRTSEEAEKDKQAAAAAAAAKMPDLEKLTPAAREKWLMAQFLTSKGWSSHRYRDLKRRQILEDKELLVEEAIFVKYFSVLERARFRKLRSEPMEKEEFEPGADDKSATKSEEPKPSPKNEEGED